MARFGPWVMGAAMGIMMPFMIHAMGAQAPVLFVLAHVVVLGGLALGAALIARRFGRPEWWPRLHRPSMRHGGQMIGGAALGFALLHVSVHGLGGI